MSTWQLRHSFIDAVSRRIENKKDAYGGQYDFVMAASSWDARSVLMAEADQVRASMGLLFNFKKRDSEGKSLEHEKVLKAFFERRCADPSIHEVEATQFANNWDIVSDLLATTFRKKGGPLDVFVDLSTIPRYLSLGIMGFGIYHGLVKSVTYAYSEGRYPTEKNGETQELFTEGGWNARAIPGFSGQWEPFRKRHYIVSVGFEGIKTRQLVSRSEPDRVSVLFPDPSVEEGYVQQTEQANKKLIDEFYIPTERIVRAQAANMNAALAQLDQANVENFKDENCMYVCCGTKPHSLALGVRSILCGEPAVLYIVPESHRVSHVRSNGVFWRYTITDCSAIRS